MKSVSQLRAWRDNLKSMAAKTGPIRDQFIARKSAVEADDSRQSDYIKAAVAEAREAAFAALAKPVAEVRNLAKAVEAETAAWRSIPYVLSQAKFNKEDAIGDALLRAQWHRELSQAPAGLFTLMVDDATRSNNTAALFQAYLVSQSRRGEAGFRPVDVSKLELPEQAEALAVIAECSTMPTQAEMVVGEISGRLSNPMATARALTRVLTPTVDFDDTPLVNAPQTRQDAPVDVTLPPAERLAQHRTQQAAP